MWAEKYIPLLRQEYPKVFEGCQTVDDYFHGLVIWFLTSIEEENPILAFPILAENKEPNNTIAYCEESYEQGYAAIINDGKLLGFRQEKE